VKKIDRKTTSLILLSIAAVAVLFAGIASTTFATDTNSTSADLSDVGESTNDAVSAPPFWDLGLMTGDQYFGDGPGSRRGFGCGFRGSMGNVEISSEYTETVNTILENDTDVQNLISKGYNVTSIRPQVKSIIGGDGTITTRASAAIVTLRNGTLGYATVNVDVTNARVTQIVILTRTVIDKSTS
jgi:hypothetical protein